MSWQYRRRRRRADTRQLAMTFTPQGMRDFGFWTEIGCTDKARRRLIVRCRCGKIATVSLEVLMSGESTSCGCAPLTVEQQKRLRDAREAGERQRELKWKPQT